MGELSAWERYKQNLGETRPWDLLNAGQYVEDDSISENRFSICKECPELISITNQCKKCGCFMAVKTKLKSATCPLNKW